jgi:YhcH/YjgK/YiaL family protein
MVQSYNTDPDKTISEAHKKYIDIHYCISGSEGIGYNDVPRLTPTTEYDEENDYLLLSGEYQKVVLHEGDFCIVFPEDAHIPMMKGDADGMLLKAVAKVKI